MASECDPDIFKNGASICSLDACRHRAEDWVQAVARESGQRVDWHYSGGIAHVLFCGDRDAVDRAIDKLAGELSRPMARKPGECGRCEGTIHLEARLLDRFEAGDRGLYRAGDATAPGVLGVCR